MQSLLYCTDRGVIGQGDNVCYDIAIILAQKLASMKVEDASASNKGDEEMINTLVEKEGGMEQMNTFIRENMLTTLDGVEKQFDKDMELLSDRLQKKKPVVNTKEMKPTKESAVVSALQASEETGLQIDILPGVVQDEQQPLRCAGDVKKISDTASLESVTNVR